MYYNTEQLNVINSEEPNIIINAGAGTGKTSTLIGSVNHYLTKFPDSKIILITFTNNAANEMKNRLVAKPHFIGTIHSFAYHELIRLALVCGFRVRLLQEKQISQIVTYLIKRAVKLKNYNHAFVEKNCFMYILNPQQFSKENEILPIYRDIENAYIDYKQKNDLYDFRDTPSYLLSKIKFYNQEIKYDKIFIDEIQDIDDTQFELIMRCNSDKLAIGDPRQSIYMFRGAGKEIFNKFEKNGFSLYNLLYNYRSKQEILDYVKADLIANKGKGGKIFTSTKIFKYNPMILCRTNKEVNEIKEYYPYVSTIHAAKGLEYPSVIVSKFPFMSAEEDENVFFVACTRAEDNLGILSFEEIIDYLKRGRVEDGI